MKTLPKLKVMLIDDAPQARRLLKMMIESLQLPAEILAEAEDIEEAFEKIKQYKPEVLLLDIEMPEGSGIDLVERLLEEDISCEVIFITAYQEYAVQAFRLSAIDYLLKPVQEAELAKAFEKVQEQKMLAADQKRLQTLAHNLRKESSERLCLPVINGYEYVSLQDIEYLEAQGAYVNIVLKDGKTYLVSKNLKHFEVLLECFTDFLRVHRSFIVNKNHIRSITKGEKTSILMQSNQSIDLARDRKQAFWKAMG